METEHPHNVDPTGQRVTPPPIPEPDHAATNGQPGLGTAARNFAEHASALVRLELELAALEINRKVSLIAKGLICAVIALVLLLYVIGFGLAAAAAGIATQLPVWAALLVVTGIVLLLTLALALFAYWSIKKGAPPVPEQAIHEAKLTQEALKSDAHPEEAVTTDASQ